MCYGSAQHNYSSTRVSFMKKLSLVNEYIANLWEI